MEQSVPAVAHPACICRPQLWALTIVSTHAEHEFSVAPWGLPLFPLGHSLTSWSSCSSPFAIRFGRLKTINNTNCAQLDNTFGGCIIEIIILWSFPTILMTFSRRDRWMKNCRTIDRWCARLVSFNQKGRACTDTSNKNVKRLPREDSLVEWSAQCTIDRKVQLI